MMPKKTHIEAVVPYRKWLHAGLWGASIGYHVGGDVLINHRHPNPNPRPKKTWRKIGENFKIGRYSKRFTRNESLIDGWHNVQ